MWKHGMDIAPTDFAMWFLDDNWYKNGNILNQARFSMKLWLMLNVIRLQSMDIWAHGLYHKPMMNTETWMLLHKISIDRQFLWKEQLKLNVMWQDSMHI
jgi:hypothetical protein